LPAFALPALHALQYWFVKTTPQHKLTFYLECDDPQGMHPKIFQAQRMTAAKFHINTLKTHFREVQPQPWKFQEKFF
jgi:hypothetical protein